MNTATIENLRRFARRYPLGTKPRVLDVGAAVVNGGISGRDVCPAEWDYVGADIAPNRNVNAVVTGEEWNLGQFDIVLSLSTLEHVERPWVHFGTLARHVRPGGYLFAIAPFAFHFHRYPIDAWRYTPDSFAVLCRDTGLRLVESYLHHSWPWLERKLSWVFWNLWSQLFKGIRQIECVCIAQKPA